MLILSNHPSFSPLKMILRIFLKNLEIIILFFIFLNLLLIF